MRCAGEAIGLRETLKEMQLVYNIRLWADASAARGLALRTGGCQIKHLVGCVFPAAGVRQGGRLDCGRSGAR